uniref:Putative salivary selenoprotein m n=1 Tax=Amblyomma triste TaxID=251400 RepID=A0A023G0I3_AMBTT
MTSLSSILFVLSDLARIQTSVFLVILSKLKFIQGSLTATTSHNAEFKRLPGHPPVILFLNANGEVVENLNMEKMTREQCNQMMLERGFRKKEKEAEKDESEEELGVKGEL